MLWEAMDMRPTYRKTSVTALEAARNRVNVLTEVVTARRNYYLIAESLQANTAITLKQKKCLVFQTCMGEMVKMNNKELSNTEKFPRKVTGLSWFKLC